MSRAAWLLHDFTLRQDIVLNYGYFEASLEAKLQALLMAIQHVWIDGSWHVIFEGDNKSVFSLINGVMKNFRVRSSVREINNFWRNKITKKKLLEK